MCELIDVGVREWVKWIDQLTEDCGKEKGFMSF